MHIKAIHLSMLEVHMLSPLPPRRKFPCCAESNYEIRSAVRRCRVNTFAARLP